jgi:hypothetical protein
MKEHLIKANFMVMALAFGLMGVNTLVNGFKVREKAKAHLELQSSNILENLRTISFMEKVHYLESFILKHIRANGKKERDIEMVNRYLPMEISIEAALWRVRV